MNVLVKVSLELKCGKNNLIRFLIIKAQLRMTVRNIELIVTI